MTNTGIFFAKIFEDLLVVNLGADATSKIKNRLNEKYGIGLYQAVMNFEILEDVLREFFGDGVHGVIANMLKHATAKKNHIPSTYELRDKLQKDTVLCLCRDGDCKTILGATIHTSMTVSEMKGLAEKPQDSIKDKIGKLIANGLLVPIPSKNNQTETCYKSILNNINLQIRGKRLDVSITINTNILSSLFSKYL